MKKTILVWKFTLHRHLKQVGIAISEFWIQFPHCYWPNICQTKGIFKYKSEDHGNYNLWCCKALDIQNESSKSISTGCSQYSAASWRDTLFYHRSLLQLVVEGECASQLILTVLPYMVHLVKYDETKEIRMSYLGHLSEIAAIILTISVS